jgi:hypothetical protein
MEGGQGIKYLSYTMLLVAQDATRPQGVILGYGHHKF